jgi:hypothetical protein
VTLLAENIDGWERLEVDCCIMDQMTKDLKWLISDRSEGPWRKEYWDQHGFQTILKVNSHQLDPDGKKAKQYQYITPCRWMVTANQLADDGASIEV